MKPKKKSVSNYISIVLLAILLAFNYRLFIVPNNFAPAGINGIATMVQYKMGFSIAYMSLLINIPLCIFAFYKVNKKFAVRTLVFCLIYSLSYLILQKAEFFTQFQYNAENVDTIYPVLIAGTISGFIYGLLFRMNSCTGGTDIVSRYVSETKPQVNFFWITFTLNCVVAVISFFVYAVETESGLSYNFKPVCLCILYSFTASFVGNFISKNDKSALEYIIITKHPEQIEDAIIKELHHTATRINGHGIFSNEDNTVLICVINNHQMVEFNDIIKRYPGTFSIRQTVNETLGNFKKIK